MVELLERGMYPLDIQTAESRWAMIVAPYDLVLTVPPKIRLEIGRFSIAALAQGRLMCNMKSELVLRVGSFCEMAEGSLLLLGGEHRNDSFFNCTMPAQGRIFRHFMDEEAARLSDSEISAPTIIGDNVLLSVGAVVTSGVTIGSGSIIGAGSVVTANCDTMTIYVGTPAKALRPRFGSPDTAELYKMARLADVAAHHIPALPSLLKRLQEGEISLDQYLGTVSFLPARPRIHLQAQTLANGAVRPEKITGYSVGDEMISAPETVSKLDAYFSQCFSKETTIQWTPDIFHTLGLY